MKKEKETSGPSIVGVEEKAVLDWIGGVSFKRKRFGGVDETDVWRKIGELNRLYEKLLIAERARSSGIGPSDDKSGEEQNDE
ncbi:MAG: hypothetical protein IKG80_03175 [Clostridia bacterium]|nr:hypothetical protein [Clostridia bacterium]